MMKSILMVTGLLAIVPATPALAQAADVADRGAGISVAVTGGTLGIGPEVGFRV